MYSTGYIVGNSSLKPQKGMHYETGVKKLSGDHEYRAALFHYRVDDYIDFVREGSHLLARNEDVKNTGVELSAKIKDDAFTYTYGITYQDPKTKQSGLGAVKAYWDRQFGRIQLKAGVAYHQDKWSAALNANYLGKRVMEAPYMPSYHTKPYLLTSLYMTYAPSDEHEISLSIDNVLDREDNLTHAGSAYYATPINYLVSYKYKF